MHPSACGPSQSIFKGKTSTSPQSDRLVIGTKIALGESLLSHCRRGIIIQGNTFKGEQPFNHMKNKYVGSLIDEIDRSFPADPI